MSAVAATATPREIVYRLRHGASGYFPGAHRSRHGDTGMEFRAHRPLLSGGDPRRLDIHASLRDPMRQWWVRVNAERMAVPVVVLADVSGSMGFEGRQRRGQVLAEFTESLAWSAQRMGDAFAFIGADAGLPPALQQWPTRQRGAGLALGAALRQHSFDGPASHSAEGLRLAAAMVPHQRSLVFLVSDFHWPDALLASVMDALAGHEVVPVVLWDRSEFQLPARNGLAWLADSEGAGHRLLWLRPALRQRWANRLDGARGALEEKLQRWRVRPLFLLDGFDADAVTAYFHA
ncbi:MAG: VWA domain-containing protein [Burkholderiales bacterium]|nr:VWA domain-containing protein [Burkholderiales bacterium]